MSQHNTEVQTGSHYGLHVCSLHFLVFLQNQTAIDSTKIPISKEGVERNMATNQSEKQSVMGATSIPGALPRDEIDRRPETGNMSFGSIMAFDGPGPETINGRLVSL